MNTFTLHHGDSVEQLKQYPDNHFDSVVTDPPYLIGFLGKGWDHKDNDLTAVFKECFRVLKPGGHLLSFSAARTYHRLAIQIEDAGFEIRDQIMWLYASGFPKAQDVGKNIQKKLGVEKTQAFKYSAPVKGGRAGPDDLGKGSFKTEGKEQRDTVCTSPEAKKWEGWKTALKPAHEPIVMARKPIKGSVVDNVQKHGTGALNIDATRIDYGEHKKPSAQFSSNGFISMKKAESGLTNEEFTAQSGTTIFPSELGRYPSNVIGETDDKIQKYFYNPKVSRGERHIGMEVESAISRVANFYGCTDPDGTEYKNGLECIIPEHGLVHRTEIIKILKELHGKEEVTAKSKELRIPFEHKTQIGGVTTIDIDPNQTYAGIELDNKYKYSPKVSSNERHIGFGKMRSIVEIARMLGCTDIDGTPYTGQDTNLKRPDGKQILVHGLIDDLREMYGKEYIDGLLAGDSLPDPSKGGMYDVDGTSEQYNPKKKTGAKANNHPTVKPVDLMRYLVKLVTPKGGIVLDPFNGSGSTGMAALAEGCDYVGCDLDANYIEIARKRISAYRDQGFEINPKKPTTPANDSFNNLFETYDKSMQ